MKYEVSGTPTVNSGSTKGWDCGIAQNEVAFDAWSSKLYTRKERAIIRELSCNAWDAHVMAGTPDKPFEIHLPTSHEPYFEITDFGTGMTPAEMENLFTLYFGSNKRGSNQTIGALGLGSKSPYCYKGNGGIYTVISRKDGKTYCYAATKVNGMPRMEQLGDVLDTPDAPNGITVKFACDHKDNWTWENEAKVALEFFSPTPKVNIPGFAPTKFAYEFKSDKWGLRKEAHTAFGYNTRAVMGNVQYAVGDIDQSLIKHGYQKKILDMPIDMFFPLGALDFSLNREALEFTEKTIAAILATADFIFEDFLKQVKDQINACQHAWEANLLIYSLINRTSNAAVYGGASMGGLINEALNAGKLYGKYKNFSLNESTIKVNELLYKDVSLTKFESNYKSSVRAKKSPVFRIEDRSMRNQTRRTAKNDPAVAAQYLTEVKADSKILFVINDTKFPGDKYIHYLLQQDSSVELKYVYVVGRISKDVTPEETTKEGKKLVADVGHPPMKLMSELVDKYPQLATVRGAGPKRERREILVLKKGHLGSKKRWTMKGWSKAWRGASEEEQTQPKKFYVVLDKLVATDTRFSTVWDFAEFIENVADAGKFGLDDDTLIFGVRRTSKLLKNNDGEFVDLMQHVYDRVKKIMTPQKTMALSLYIKPFSDHNYLEMLSHLAMKQPLQNSPMQNFAQTLEEARDHKESNWQAFRWVLDFAIGRGQYTMGNVVDFNTQWNGIKRLYPMLALMNDYQARSNKETVIEYIKMVDEENQREALAKAAASNS
jgi:hypothetical protein